ncbi:hypothetical protein UFOVP22_30 [uncultured Caudovirales phage]|uniref:Uncharacterized protein n=1 Tax=uncultured Caudovirales phage TaxID=2100421 RepID=A0A6J5TAQ8_9CAUD|nr:hypothetical protein UFOVP22_30 [uncultured Caudovirales phage]
MSVEACDSWLKNNPQHQVKGREAMLMYQAWQAAQADQAEYIAMLELNNKFKDDANQKLRKALDRLASLGNEPNFGNSVGNVIACEALGVNEIDEQLGEIK